MRAGGEFMQTLLFTGRDAGGGGAVSSAAAAPLRLENESLALLTHRCRNGDGNIRAGCEPKQSEAK